MPQLGRSKRFSSQFEINGRPNTVASTIERFTGKLDKDGKPIMVTITTPSVARSLTPKMFQVSTSYAKPLSYIFPVGITGINHDSAVVEYSEVNRPRSMPLVDSVAPTLHKLDFSFMVVVPNDSLIASVDDQISLLQDFASADDIVGFSNAHKALTETTWQIQSFSFEIAKFNESMQATQANCGIQLVEASYPSNKRFLKLPKFSYTTPKGQNGSSTKTGEDEEFASRTIAMLKNQMLALSAEWELSIADQKRISDAVRKQDLDDARAAELVRKSGPSGYSASTRYEQSERYTKTPTKAEFVDFVINFVIRKTA